MIGDICKTCKQKETEGRYCICKNDKDDHKPINTCSDCGECIGDKAIHLTVGTLFVNRDSHELIAYEMKTDNPLHCLHSGHYHGEKTDIAIYSDSIIIHPKGLGGNVDAFVIKFPKKIQFELKTQNEDWIN